MAGAQAAAGGGGCKHGDGGAWAARLATSYLDGLGSASAPAPTPLTRFDPEDEPMWNLVNAVRESYRIRAEAAVALEQLGRDFSRDFSPAEHPHRRPARSLVIKASNIVSRLQAMEGPRGAAAIGLRIAQSGASERESIISTLQQELKLLDEDAQRELFSMKTHGGPRKGGGAGDGDRASAADGLHGGGGGRRGPIDRRVQPRDA